MSYAGFRDARRISELTKQVPSFRSLRLFAKQLKFTVDLPGHRGSKPRLIADLIPLNGFFRNDPMILSGTLFLACYTNAIEVCIRFASFR